MGVPGAIVLLSTVETQPWSVDTWARQSRGDVGLPTGTCGLLDRGLSAACGRSGQNHPRSLSSLVASSAPAGVLLLRVSRGPHGCDVPAEEPPHSGHHPCPHQQGSVHPDAPWGPHFQDCAPFREQTPCPLFTLGESQGRRELLPAFICVGRPGRHGEGRTWAVACLPCPTLPAVRNGAPVCLPPPQPGKSIEDGLNSWRQDLVGVSEVRSEAGLRPGAGPQAASFLAVSPARGRCRQGFAGAWGAFTGSRAALRWELARLRAPRSSAWPNAPSTPGDVTPASFASLGPGGRCVAVALETASAAREGPALDDVGAGLTAPGCRVQRPTASGHPPPACQTPSLEQSRRQSGGGWAAVCPVLRSCLCLRPHFVSTLD